MYLCYYVYISEYEGTYGVQNIVVGSCTASLRDRDSLMRSVSIDGDFIDGTSATGLLIMLYSSNQADVVADYNSMLTFSRPSFHVICSGLKSNHTYNMSTFIIDENGLPLEQAATLSQIVPFPSLMNTCGISM